MKIEELNNGSICPGCGKPLGKKELTAFQSYTQKVISGVPLYLRDDVRVRHAGVWYCGKCIGHFDTWSRRIICSHCGAKVPAKTSLMIDGGLYCASCVQKVVLPRIEQVNKQKQEPQKVLPQALPPHQHREKTQKAEASANWLYAAQLQKIYEDYLSHKKSHPYATVMTMSPQEIRLSTGPSYTAVIRNGDASWRVETWDEPERHATEVHSCTFADEESAMRSFLQAISMRAFTSYDFLDMNAYQRVKNALTALRKWDMEPQETMTDKAQTGPVPQDENGPDVAIVPR